MEKRLHFANETGLTLALLKANVSLPRGVLNHRLKAEDTERFQVETGFLCYCAYLHSCW